MTAGLGPEEVGDVEEGHAALWPIRVTAQRIPGQDPCSRECTDLRSEGPPLERAEPEALDMPALVLASSDAGLYAVMTIVYVAVVVFEIAALWQVFVKAGRPGWAAIIPIYNLYVLLKVIGRPGWWLLLFLVGIIVPFLGWILLVVISIIVAIDLARSFAKSSGFAVGLFFLNFIFVPILGFGESRYVGPAAGGPRAMTV
jgi:hypothetical protein